MLVWKSGRRTAYWAYPAIGKEAVKTVVTLKSKQRSIIIILASSASRTLHCTAIRTLVLCPGTLYGRGARTRRCLPAQALLRARTRPLSWLSRPEAEVITSVPGPLACAQFRLHVNQPNRSFVLSSWGKTFLSSFGVLEEMWYGVGLTASQAQQVLWILAPLLSPLPEVTGTANSYTFGGFHTSQLFLGLPWYLSW